MPKNILLESGWPGGPVYMNPNKELDFGRPDLPLYPDYEDSNLLKFIRQRNIFGAPEITPSSIPKPEDDFDYIGRMRELYQPEHSASDRFSQALSAMPQREKPSFMRKLTSSLMAPRGIETQDQVLNEPYYNKLRDWKLGLDPLESLMKEERAQNANLRGLATSAVTQERLGRISLATNERLERKRIEEEKFRRDKLEETTRIADEKLEDQRKRTELLEFAKNNPKAHFEVGPDGTLIAVHPVTGQRLNTNSNVRVLTALDRIELQTKGALREIGARGAVESRLIDERGEEARKTKAAPGTEQPEVVTEQEVTTKDAEGKPFFSRSSTTKRKPLTRPTNTDTFNPAIDKMAPPDIQKKASPGRVYVLAPDGNSYISKSLGK